MGGAGSQEEPKYIMPLKGVVESQALRMTSKEYPLPSSPKGMRNGSVVVCRFRIQLASGTPKVFLASSTKRSSTKWVEHLFNGFNFCPLRRILGSSVPTDRPLREINENHRGSGGFARARNPCRVRTSPSEAPSKACFSWHHQRWKKHMCLIVHSRGVFWNQSVLEHPRNIFGVLRCFFWSRNAIGETTGHVGLTERTGQVDMVGWHDARKRTRVQKMGQSHPM